MRCGWVQPRSGLRCLALRFRCAKPLRSCKEFNARAQYNMPLTGRSDIPSHGSRTRVLHGAAKIAGLVLTLICLLVTSLVESQEAVTNSRNVPALRSAVNTEPAAASALLTFEQASRTFRNFKV